MIRPPCLRAFVALRWVARKFAMVRPSLPGYQEPVRNMAEKVGSG